MSLARKIPISDFADWLWGMDIKDIGFRLSSAYAQLVEVDKRQKRALCVITQVIGRPASDPTYPRPAAGGVHARHSTDFLSRGFTVSPITNRFRLKIHDNSESYGNGSSLALRKLLQRLLTNPAPRIGRKSIRQR